MKRPEIGCVLLSVALGLFGSSCTKSSPSAPQPAATPSRASAQAFPQPEALVRIEVEYSAGTTHLQVDITRRELSYRFSLHGPGRYFQRELTDESFNRIATDLMATGIFEQKEYKEYHASHVDPPYSIKVYDTLGASNTVYVPHSRTHVRSSGSVAPTKIGQWINRLGKADN